MSATAITLEMLAAKMKEWEQLFKEEHGVDIQLRGNVIAEEGTTSMDQMLQIIAAQCEMPTDAFYHPARLRDHVELRFLAAHFSNVFFPKMSLSHFARIIKKDHTTVIHMRKTANDLIETQNEVFYPKYLRCKAALELWFNKKQEAGNE